MGVISVRLNSDTEARLKRETQAQGTSFRIIDRFFVLLYMLSDYIRKICQLLVKFGKLLGN